MARIVKVCPICGKEFETLESILKSGKGKYCSKECQTKGLQKKIEVTCSLCDKTFFKNPSQLNESKNYICPECYSERKNNLKKICPACGKHFKAKHSRQKYCSYECSKARYEQKGNLYLFRDDCIHILVETKNYGRQYIIIDKEDYSKVKQYTWQTSYCKGTDKFYAVSSRHNQKNVKLHRLIMNCPKGMIVDHINHNPLDNRKCNLRICSPRSNSLNISIRKNNKSGYTGILKTKSGNYTVIYCKKCYGTYKTLEEAIEVRKQAELQDKESLIYYLQNN